jgi:hypothetical protein
MTVCRRASISAMETRRHRCAMCLGSDWSRKNKLPYFCVFSSLGKKPSCSSAASSRWLATSFCYGGRQCRTDSTPGAARLTSSSAMRFWISRAMRESRYRTSFSRTKFFLDCDEMRDLSSRSVFWAARQSVGRPIGQAGARARAHLLLDRPQSPALCPLQTWTGTGP